MPATAEGSVLRFGRWCIDLRRRELLEHDNPVPLGGRAFDIVEVLVEASGELVTKADLMDRVWPGLVVEDNLLQVHISAIRKALGADRNLLKTASGRGYRLFGTWAADPAPAPARTSPAITDTPPQRGNLPNSASQLIGRDDALQHVAALVSTHRVVTLTGTGGIGKTRLALEVARRLGSTFPDGVWLIELAALSDPALVPTTIAATVGVDLGVNEVSPVRLAEAIAKRQLLVVLDNCEHLVDSVARLVAGIVRAGAAPCILATSQEPLLVEGEHVYNVPGLDIPADLTEAAVAPGAVQLFIARMQAAQPNFTPSPQSLSDIATICRRLDGIPLAIELAAASAAPIGIAETAAHINDRFALLTQGRRTAPPRHRTLRAMLDWSYNLLSPTERTVLQRLAIFAGGFTLDAACSVLGTPELPGRLIADTLFNLARKSLLALDHTGTDARYVLLETVRAYALDLLDHDEAGASLARRHAIYFRDLFDRAHTAWHDQAYPAWLQTYRAELNNVRAALDWCYGPQGDASVAVALTDRSIPLMYDLSLVGECRRSAAKALAAIASGVQTAPQHEMHLLAVVQAARVYTDGPSPASFEAWQKVLDMATRLGDPEYQARALWGLWNDHTYAGSPTKALAFAERFAALGAANLDAAKQIMGRRLIGISRHYAGDQPAARLELEHVLANYVRSVHRWQTIGSRLDQATVTRATLARVLWLQGETVQAQQIAERAAQEAAAEDHAQSILYILVEASIPLAIWSRDLAAASRLLETLLEQAARSGFAIWEIYGRCVRAMLGVLGSKAGAGVAEFRDAIHTLDKTGFRAHLAMFLGLLAEAQARAGSNDDASATVDAALRRCNHHGEGWCTADLLRIKAEIIARDTAPTATAQAQRFLTLALDRAREQGALSWALRAALALAQMRQSNADAAAARAQLASVYAQFPEESEMPDMITARSLLNGG